MALGDGEEQVYNGEELSSMSVIESYLRSADFMKDGPMEQWNVLSAIQREIDLRYAVTTDRHISSFIDVASYKGQIQIEALREIQREIYELAPNFIDMRLPYRQTYFNLFPQYFSPSAMNEDVEYSIEHLFQNGTTPIQPTPSDRSTLVQYKDFLLNVCYWLTNFRYVNACPYTFTLSTYTRDWSWSNTSNDLCSYYLPLSDCYDIWQYNLGQHERSANKKDWELSNDISADSNGMPYSGIQVEMFQWFRTQNLNPVDFSDPRHPIGMEYFNGFPAQDDPDTPAAMMPHKTEGWELMAREDLERLTADWKQYEWELSTEIVKPRHIPYDLNDWQCYVRLSTVTDWSVLEYAFDPVTSARWASQVSAGWDSVMTNEQIADWGTGYLSAFPNRGMTGKIIGMPILSGTASKGDFFDKRGHSMTYKIDLRRQSSLHERWVDKYANESETIYDSEEYISMHKENVPLSATIENPFALSADACYVMYSTRLPEVYDYTRDITDYSYDYPSYPTDGLRMDYVIEQEQKSRDINYRDTRTPSMQPHYKVTYYYEVRDRFEDVKAEDTDYGHYKTIRYLIDGSKSLLVEDEEVSSGIHWDSGWHKMDDYYGYADSFGLLTGEPMSSLSGDEISAPDWYPIGEGDQTAHVFYRAFPMSAYSYETLFAHLSNDFPPIDYDLLDFFDKNPPDGPWYEPGGWGGIGNTVELDQTSQMRLYTFFDFSESFGLNKEQMG